MKRLRKSIYSSEQTLLREWLVEKRHEKKLSQRDLAIKLEVVHSVVGKVENGERRLDVIEFLSYCDILGADPHEFLTLFQKRNSSYSS